MDGVYKTRGFLPARDPLTAFPSASELSALRNWTNCQLLEDAAFELRARSQKSRVAQRRRAKDTTGTGLYTSASDSRSAYSNQVSQREHRVRAPAVPLCKRARCWTTANPQLRRLALYQWKPINPDAPAISATSNAAAFRLSRGHCHPFMSRSKPSPHGFWPR